MKKCTKCGEEKVLTEFVKHKSYKDGHYSQCKVCTRALVSKWQKDNPDKKNKIRSRYRENNRENIRIQDQEYYKNNAEMLREKSKEKMKKYFDSKGKETRKKDKALHPERHEARMILSCELRAGRLIKPEFCQICNGKGQRIEGHHADYSKPLEIIWLCTPCHRHIHRKIDNHRERLSEKTSKKEEATVPTTEETGRG